MTRNTSPVLRKLLENAAALRSAGRLEESETQVRAILSRDSDYPDALQLLGCLCSDQNRNDEAIGLFRAILAEQPDHEAAIVKLAFVYLILNREKDAETVLLQGLEHHPGSWPVRIGLGNVMQKLGRLEDAVTHYREAQRIDPQSAESMNNLGTALEKQGFVEEALALYRDAIAVDPHYLVPLQNLALALNYRPETNQEEIFKVSQDWGRSMMSYVSRTHETPGHDRQPDKRLRVGFLSPDFRLHPVTFFIIPFLQNRDSAEVETFCYGHVSAPDHYTDKIRQACDHWRDISGLSAEHMLDAIREDGIDILVDLAGLTAGTMLHLLAPRPAPVQASWLGYPNTTGLDSVDYRLTDPIADPPSDEALFYAEQLVRLPPPFLCYSPPDEAPAPALSGIAEVDGFTFVSFNNPKKINAHVMRAWGRILAGAPRARLVIKAPELGCKKTRERLTRRLTKAGVDSARVTLLTPHGPFADHLATYRKADLALDTFPYGGTTTTCEALWMGVPALTLTGDRHAARVGATLLESVGLPSLVTHSEDDYVARAIRLATRPEIDPLPRGRDLRDRMKASPLCDGAQFARKMEMALREMWHRYCAGEQ